MLSVYLETFVVNLYHQLAKTTNNDCNNFDKIVSAAFKNKDI